MHTLKQPKLGFLIGIFFLATFCFACFESTLPLLLDRTFHYDETQLGYLFAYCGFVAAMVQGGLVGRLVKRFGEPMLISLSLIGVAVSLALLPFMGSLGAMLIALGLFAIFSGINRAPTMGMISLNAPENEQGSTLGVAQSAGTLARIFGPIFATTLYMVKPALPYVICAGVALIASFLAWYLLARGSEPKKADPA
jgi:MFS family permease